VNGCHSTNCVFRSVTPIQRRPEDSAIPLFPIQPPVIAANMESTWIDLSSIITMVVASTGTEFVVHKHVACAKPPFVAACLKEHTSEAREQKIEVQEWDDDDSMRTLIVWMYQGKSVLRIPVSLLEDRSNIEARVRVGTLQVRLTKLYLLADRFLIPELKNNIVDCIDATEDFGYTTSTMATHMLFENGPSECKLKSYLTWSIGVQMEQACKHPDNVLGKHKQVHRRTIDVPSVAQAILRLLVEGIPDWKGICDYHEHDADNSARRCGNSSDWVIFEDDVAMDDEIGNAKDQGPPCKKRKERS